MYAFPPLQSAQLLQLSNQPINILNLATSLSLRWLCPSHIN